MDFFPFDDLPPLSSERTGPRHLAEVVARLADPHRPAAFEQATIYRFSGPVSPIPWTRTASPTACCPTAKRFSPSRQPWPSAGRAGGDGQIDPAPRRRRAFRHGVRAGRVAWHPKAVQAALGEGWRRLHFASGDEILAVTGARRARSRPSGCWTGCRRCSTRRSAGWPAATSAAAIRCAEHWPPLI